jgi:hypothetical protein
MSWSADEILSVLDECCDVFTFPMLDNGYVYLAATRLSLYRSSADWAMVVEVFGYSPRSGVPDTHIYTFGSRLRRLRSADQYVSREAFENHVANNPNNESEFIYPIEEGEWMDPADEELVTSGQHRVFVRGVAIDVPPLDAYARHGISLAEPTRARVFELCRYLAAVDRNAILATTDERLVCVPVDLAEMMRLDEWDHPNVAKGERPGSNATFQSLADVLASGDKARYRPVLSPNTHWRNWPDGGTL